MVRRRPTAVGRKDSLRGSALWAGLLTLGIAGAAWSGPPELTATWNGRFVHLRLPGSYLRYTIERAEGDAPFHLLSYAATGCTGVCTYDDVALNGGTQFQYRVKAMQPDSSLAIFGPAAIAIELSSARSLESHFAPNPTTGATRLQYQIPATLAGNADVPVTVTLHDVVGRELRRFEPGRQELGVYSLLWDGKNGAGSPVTTGTYFYRVQAGDVVEVGRVVVLR